MKALLVQLIVSSTLLVSQVSVSAAPHTSGLLQENSRQEADKLWEQAVLAKGGRVNLHAVSNMVASSRIKGTKYLVKPFTLRYEHFFVFPDRSWTWVDESESGIFDIKVLMLNLERNLTYLTYPNDPGSPRVSQLCPDCTDLRYSILRAQFRYLMESRWVRPVPLSASKERRGFGRVDVVRTLVNGERVDFVLDGKSHLPLEFSHYYKFRGEESIHTESMSDYVEIGGIKVPRRITERRFRYRVEYRINVQYDESLFEDPPTIEAGSEAWKAKQK
ncbi:MAG TPA: hypothetical protein VGX24_13740 [Pyrinomonadaceae bacterium]|nr:hypothetical protein [Pyrinomonadaceae bacterium]